MNARVFLATTGRGVARAVKSETGNWSVEHLLVDQDVRCLAADPSRPNLVYAGTQGSGVLRSDDGGKSWTTYGLAGTIVKALAVSPREPNTIYAGTNPAMIFRSRDGVASWNECAGFRQIRYRWLWFSPAEPPFQAYIQSIVVSPTDPRRIVAGVEFGAVVLSEDGGETWSGHRPGALRDCHSLAWHASDGDWVYEGGGTGAGVAISQNGGKTWTQPRDGLDRHYGWACAADPENPRVAYVSLSPSAFKAHGGKDAQAGIFRTVDGSRWQKLGGGLPQPLAHMPYALLTDAKAAGHLYAGLDNGDVWFSSDQGDSWETLPFNLGGIQRSLVML